MRLLSVVTKIHKRRGVGERRIFSGPGPRTREKNGALEDSSENRADYFQERIFFSESPLQSVNAQS